MIGQDFAGEVISIGEAVTGIEASDTVYGFANGAYAEYAVVSLSMIASKPRTVGRRDRRRLADARTDRAADRRSRELRA
jgi:NADPH:quinone reductase-like Zn-dependent oxidoreductase